MLMQVLLQKTLQEALDNWKDCEEKLLKLFNQLQDDKLPEDLKAEKLDLKKNTCTFTKSI